MELTLNNPKLEEFISQEVTSGRFDSAEELIASAVARLMDDARVRLTDAEEDAILRANEQAENGQWRHMDDVAADLRKRAQGR